MNCRACGTTIIPFFSLGNMPLVNSFLKQEQISQEKKYPLVVAFCSLCYLVQLTETIPPEALFTDYIYFSSTSTSFLEHCKRTAEYLAKRFKLTTQSLVLEIASNDGAQLQYFKALGMNVLGVDPAKNIADVANQRGLTTLPSFFTSTLAKKLHDENGVEADLIYGANVLAHVPEIIDFVQGVSMVLKPKGTAVFEFPYVKGLMENKFDTIYHEHVFYYSLLALRNLFAKAYLEIYDAEMTPTQGSSLRIFVCHQGAFFMTDALRMFEKQERSEKLDQLETYQRVDNNITQLKQKLIRLLQDIKKQGKKIAGYSAPAKGNILLNYFDIHDNYLDFIVDKSPQKQGLYTPGTHLLVKGLDAIHQKRPDYLLVLCWNIYEEVMAMEELREFRNRGGKFIIPVPEVRII